MGEDGVETLEKGAADNMGEFLQSAETLYGNFMRHAS